MDPKLLETHEILVVEIANVYLDNMESELGKKYKNKQYQINAGLSDDQYMELKTRHNVSSNEFAELYSEFRKMKPTRHLKKVMDAFTASGGNVDIVPVYDENTQKLQVSVSYVVKDNTLEKIEGLTPLEDIIVKMNAMLQVETVLSGSNADISTSF